MYRQHIHSNSTETVLGIALVRGATLREGDIYDSTSGKWVACSIAGEILGHTMAQWVRPRNLTPQEKILLASLVAPDLKSCYCIAKNVSDSRRYLVIPSPTYNGDTRISIGGVNNTECIEPLLDFGILVKSLSESEYGDEIYLLSKKGQEIAKQCAN